MSLRSSSEWRSAADLLDDIRWNLNVDGYGAAWWMRDCAYSSSATAGFLSGYNYGPITDIAGNTYELREYLSGSYYGPLTDIRDYMSGYSYGVLTDIASGIWNVRDHLSGYNGGPLTSMDYTLYNIQSNLWNGWLGVSAADLLGEIRNDLSAIRGQTDQMSFDGNGRLRVETQ